MRRLNVDIDEQVKRISIIFEKNKLATDIFLSAYLSVHKGRGIEFEGFRVYSYEDDASEIDWLTSVRAGELMVREYKIDKNLDLVIMLDVSDSMLYSSTKKLKIEYAIELAAVIAHLALNAGSAVGLILFNDKIVRRVHMDSSINHFNIIRSVLLNVKNYGGRYNFSKNLLHVSKSIPPGTMIFVISDFIGMDARWKSVLESSSFQFDIVGCMVRDRNDKALPKAGYVQLSGPFEEEAVIVDVDAVRDYFEEEVRKNEAEIKNSFMSHNLTFLNIKTDLALEELINEFLRKRVVKIR